MRPKRPGLRQKTGKGVQNLADLRVRLVRGDGQYWSGAIRRACHVTK